MILRLFFWPSLLSSYLQFLFEMMISNLLNLCYLFGSQVLSLNS
jgi:hypothetical protein